MKEAFFLQLREAVRPIATTLINLRPPASPIAIPTGRSGSCSYRQGSYREITHSMEHGFRRDDEGMRVRLKIKSHRQRQARLGRTRSRLASPGYRPRAEPLALTRVSVSMFQPLIFSVRRDPIECLPGKRAAMIRSSPGNSET